MRVQLELNATVICHNDRWVRVWLDCLRIDSEGFMLLAESNQILLKISFILILLTFIYLVALYQKNEL